MDIFLEASSYLTAHGIPVSVAAQEDPDDDQVFAQDGVPPSSREQSESPSGARSSDSSVNLSPLDPDSQVELDPEKQLQRRRMVLNKVLENERVYISELESLLVPLRPLRAAAYTSQPVLTSQEIQNIFFKIPELLEIHREFHSQLSERVQDSDDSQQVADLFHQLVKQFGVYRAFVNNYPMAMETAEKCIQNKQQFRKIAERMKLKHSKDSKEGSTTTLEALLHKPVNHITRFTLLIREVLNNTPRDHSDFCELVGALNDSNRFLSATNQNIDSSCPKQVNYNSKVQYLLKDGFAVEVCDNSRKLRHIFLSTELFFCTRSKKQVGRQPQYKCEWSVPLEELSVQSQSEIHLMDPARLHSTPPRQIEETKAKVLHSKIQIYLDKKQNKGGDRLKRKLYEFESWLLLNSPSIPLGLQDRNGKSYLFLVSSEFELHDWQETIERAKKHGFQSFCASPSEVQVLINTYIAQRSTHSVPLHSNLEDLGERTLRGTITLQIHSISGFTHPLNVYCTFEADTNGYFEKKAQTNVLNQVTNPTWEEEIDIQLDGAQSLRVLLWQQHDYRTSSKLNQEYGSDLLLSKAQIWLDPKTLHSKERKELTIRMNGHEMRCSMRYLHQSLNQLEEMARALCATFGVPISIVAYRDRSRIPLIVRHCAEDVERRGLNELGIYRVSGIATDVQILKEAFDRNTKDAVACLRDHDINVVAGTLKLYFRELPEPLLTDELIPAFVTAAAQEDPATKDKQMTAVLNQLPEPNLSTFLFLMRHLRRVTQHENVNKMTLHNLATVFGPSLLRVRNEGIPMDISHEVVAQVQVIYYFLSDDNVSLLEQRERLGSVSMEM